MKDVLIFRNILSSLIANRPENVEDSVKSVIPKSREQSLNQSMSSSKKEQKKVEQVQIQQTVEKPIQVPIENPINLPVEENKVPAKVFKMKKFERKPPTGKPPIQLSSNSSLLTPKKSVSSKPLEKSGRKSFSEWVRAVKARKEGGDSQTVASGISSRVNFHKFIFTYNILIFALALKQWLQFLGHEICKKFWINPF